MCIHIFLLNSHLRWSSVLCDFSYCMQSGSFGLWHCSIFSCCLKWKRSECEEADADWLHLHFLTGCQKVKGDYGPLVPASLTLNKALFLNTIIVSGCHLKEMLHVQLLQKWWVVLPSKAMFIALPSAEDGWLPLLLAALGRELRKALLWPSDF